MREYLDLCNKVTTRGVERSDRTGTGVISLFGVQHRYDLRKGFPLVTTKKVHLKSIIHELLWFIHGDTNIKYLVDNNVNIWNDWPYKKFQESDEYQGESMKEFVSKIKKSDSFAAKWGELGPVYGKQWTDFNGVNQLNYVINEIETNPTSRRIILSAWNPEVLEEMALPPCHTLIQFYAEPETRELSLQLYQRSGDVFLGVPFNIASYSLLLMMVAQITGYTPKEFIHIIGDAHIYSNHIDQINLQLSRTPYELPQMIITPRESIYDYTFKDFKLENYKSHSAIKGKVAV